MNKLLIKSTLATAIALSIAACSPADSEGVAGIGGSGYVSSGSVTGFGSVFVNGVEFETDSSTFDVDGISGTQDDLAIGMIVQVSGSINADGITGNATSIRYDDELEGPVSGLMPLDPTADNLTRTFSVLGVNVIIDSSSTTFDISDDIIPAPAFDFNEINNGNNIEVSGFFNSVGDLIATRAELKDVTFDPSSIVEVKGKIANLSISKFDLGNPSELTIDASDATLVDLPNDVLADELWVEVKGTLDTVKKVLKATKVESEYNSPDDIDEFEVEGLINNYDSNNSTFTINGIDVNASGATLEPDTLILENDIRVEVEGAIVNGTLVATEIESEDGDIKVHASVTSVDVDAKTFKVEPVLGQPEITVTLTSGTQLEGDTNDDQPYTLTHLSNNLGFVEVRGFDDGNGGITAVEIDVKELDKVIVQGYATAATGTATSGTITVFGITFSFDNKTEFDDDADNDITDPADINALIADIKNPSIAPLIIKIEDKDENGGPDGIADEIDIE